MKLRKIVSVLLICVSFSCNFRENNEVYDYYLEDKTLRLYSKFNNIPLENNWNKLELASDRFGNNESSVQFNNNSYISFGNILNDVFSGENKNFSISLWIKPLRYDSNVSLIAKNSDSNCDENQRQLHLKLSKERKIQFILFSPEGYSLLESENQLRKDEWSNLIICYNGNSNKNLVLSKVKLYINGINTHLILKEGISELKSIKSSTAQLAIGAMVDSQGNFCGNNFYKGLMDDLLIFARTLSNNEIEHLASLN